jgi:hypothetical protein
MQFMKNSTDQTPFKVKIPFMIKPYSDTSFDMTQGVLKFDDVENLWEEVDKNSIDRREVARMASALLDSYIKMDLNPYYGYYPVIFMNDEGIHPGIFLDLDILYIKKNYSDIQFFLPEQILSEVSQ